MFRLVIASISVGLFLMSSCHLDDKEFFVSPNGHDENPGTFKKPLLTIEGVKLHVADFRAQHPEGDIHVWFREGEYKIERTLVFTHSDGGGEGWKVSYASYKDEKVLFTGGERLNDWTIEENGLWATPIDPAWEIEQLYVDDNRAIRARYPDQSATPSRLYLRNKEVGYNKDSSRMDEVFLELEVTDQLHHLEGAEDFEVVIFKDWATLRKQVQFVDAERDGLTLKPPFALFDGGHNGLFASWMNRFTCYFEGHPAFISEPGEWAIDQEKGLLFYYPLENQVPESTEIIAPRVKTLIHLKGDSDQPVCNLHFSGIHFSHAAYVLPDFGHDGRQACFYYSKGTEIKGHEAIIEDAIRFDWAINCSMAQGELIHTGSNGIHISTGCCDNVIKGFSINDIGGNSVMIGTAYDPGDEVAKLPQRNQLINCKIQTGGQHYQSAVAVWLGFGAWNQIARNAIFDHPYTGISVGWQWNPLPSSSHDNLIYKNHIYEVMQMLGDGGGIYTLGYQPGSIIEKNHIHDILRSELNHASPNNGMFIDEGSKGYLIKSNRIHDVSHTCIRGHRASGVTLENNTFVAGEYPAISHTPPYGNMIFVDHDTTVTWSNPGWPAEWGYGDLIEAFYMKDNTFR